MYYVYLLKNEVDALYIGCTNDLRRRLNEHNLGKSEFTKGHQWIIVYYEAYKSKHDAFAREKKLKYHGYGIRHLKSRCRESLII
ncbi:MAG: GIY-YIG nuclease family protein [Patescibacteria group bacterium]